VSVCLTGSFDDFSIQDILQIIAFVRKTGCLSLETEMTGGAIVFRKGRVLACVDDGGAPLERELGSLRGYERHEVIRRRISAALDRFARSREGEFSFQVSAQPPRVIAGRDIAPETLETGIDVIELLLELAGGPERQPPAAPEVAAAPWSPQSGIQVRRPPSRTWAGSGREPGLG